jgi:hypothetical protein
MPKLVHQTKRIIIKTQLDKAVLERLQNWSIVYDIPVACLIRNAIAFGLEELENNLQFGALQDTNTLPIK